MPRRAAALLPLGSQPADQRVERCVVLLLGVAGHEEGRVLGTRELTRIVVQRLQPCTCTYTWHATHRHRHRHGHRHGHTQAHAMHMHMPCRACR
eukprot:scaffold67483_cov54-Phaeocystis_antarctica.AAC.2